MTFYNFMMKNHLGEDTPCGDLAGDMRKDKERFPRNGKSKYAGWHRLIREYLMDKNAYDGCLETFEKCWKEYLIYEGKSC